MIRFEHFAVGLTKIGIALKQPYDAASMAVYHDILGSQTDHFEWQRFVQWALKVERWPTFAPKLPEIQEALRIFRGARPMLEEASDAYHRVLEAGIYSAEGGTSWNYRAIKQSCGDAAAEAFLAAGGNSAFVTTFDEAKRRERFVAAYAGAVREEPAAALLPAGPPGESAKALPLGEEPPTREEAAAVVEKLRGMVDVKPAPAKARVVELTDERRAKLERQKAELGITPPEAQP